METIFEYAFTGLLSLLGLAMVALTVLAVVQWFQASNARLTDVVFWSALTVAFLLLCVGIGAAVHESTNGILLERLRDD